MIGDLTKPGLYIHVPFCHSKCSYCDFYSVTSSGYRNRYLKALVKEIKACAAAINTDDVFNSVYIGGGTPSLLKAADLGLILSALRANFNLAKNSEVTLEVNPCTLDENAWQEYIGMGVNRIHIGVQSFLDHELKILGRRHTAAIAEHTFLLARKAGFVNVGIDLMYGIPGQQLSDWKYNLNTGIHLQPEHISAYNLTIEPGTVLAQDIQAGKLHPPDEEMEIAFYLTAEKRLTHAGYLHYEISNYARSAALIAQHNYKYWMHAPYLGFGPSAHSFWNGRRWSNHRSVKQYCLDLQHDRLPVAYQEQLNRSQMMLEHIYMSLRTCRGLNLNRFTELFKCNFLLTYKQVIQKLKQNRLIVVDKEYVTFTTKGMLISDEILSYFALD
jgi:oxygen-independent coproporphyrinogen-3 oxidase